MPRVVVTVSEEEAKKLIYICTYYGTTVSTLVSEYIKYLTDGNIPHGYEHVLTGVNLAAKIEDWSKSCC